MSTEPALSDPQTARTELRAELLRITRQLAQLLQAQRHSGRTPETDALRGMAIDEGEAEGLLHALAAELADPQQFPNRATENSPDGFGLHDADYETPLRRAARVFRMSSAARDALLLACAVELDARFSRLVAYFNDHIAHTRPTVGLALAVAACDVGAVEFCAQPAIRQGLLMLEGDGPVSGLKLRVAPEMLPRLIGEPTGRQIRDVRLHEDRGFSLDQLVIGSGHRAYLRRWAAWLRAAENCPPLLIAGAPGSGRATAARAASAEAGRRLVECDWNPERADHHARLAVAAREALWHQAALLARIAPDTRIEQLAYAWSELSAWDLPLVLAIPPHLVEPACAVAPVEPAVIGLEALTIEQREKLWQLLVDMEDAAQRPALTDAEYRELAARFDFVPGTLARALRRAVADWHLSGRQGRLDFAALTQSCRAVGTSAMGAIAHRLAQPYTRDDLVLPQDLMNELDLASSWVRNRRRVFEDWGFGRRIAMGQGLTALFAGEPGTGKTMAAQVLARELGLEIFRVDLSRVMSKYIGETEKNLSQLFDDAQASGAILFFDEADALFGKRSEVKDAHDRYANLEIGYLLQRMEEHVGTTILATNRMRDLDEAFTRRFHFILDFPMPRAPERRRIWEGMLPREAEREPEIDIEALARDYEISGGEIRNSVLSAAFVAADEGVPIGLRHLKRGLRRELIKTGRVLDMKQRRALDGE